MGCGCGKRVERARAQREAREALAQQRLAARRERQALDAVSKVREKK